MKKSGIRRGRFAAIALVLAAGLLPPLAAQAELRIGYVNAVRVIEEAPQGVAALKKLEAEFGPRDQALVALQSRIRTLEEGLQKPGATLTDSERRSREVLALKRELKRATQEFREDYNQRRNDELATLQQLVRKTILEIAKQEKYDLILHEGALYASEAIDITDQVLKRLGKP
jgi:outer membrane protein